MSSACYHAPRDSRPSLKLCRQFRCATQQEFGVKLDLQPQQLAVIHRQVVLASVRPTTVSDFFGMAVQEHDRMR